MIEIATEKTLVRGVPHRRIHKVVAVEKEQLPTKYLEEGMCCYMVKDQHCPCLRIIAPPCKSAWITVGDSYTEEWFQESLQMIKQCGDRLHEINKEIAELKRTWVGEESFLI